MDVPAHKPPRFPYVAAVLCAACLGAAAWTWMRYSYCWDVTPADLRPLVPENEWPLCLGRYVELRGVARHAEVYACLKGRFVAVPPRSQHDCYYVWVSEPSASERRVAAFVGDYRWSPGNVTFVGRVGTGLPNAAAAGYVDTTAGRFHGASVAGLVVGAMGVFVFTAALRHWHGGVKGSRCRGRFPQSALTVSRPRG